MRCSGIEPRVPLLSPGNGRWSSSSQPGVASGRPQRGSLPSGHPGALARPPTGIRPAATAAEARPPVPSPTGLGAAAAPDATGTAREIVPGAPAIGRDVVPAVFDSPAAPTTDSDCPAVRAAADGTATTRPPVPDPGSRGPPTGAAPPRNRPTSSASDCTCCSMAREAAAFSARICDRSASTPSATRSSTSMRPSTGSVRTSIAAPTSTTLTAVSTTANRAASSPPSMTTTAATGASPSPAQISARSSRAF